MDWYQVIKTIRGRRYLYWQKTYRVGRKVKTLNEYIGPAGSSSGAIGGAAAQSVSLPQSTYSAIAPMTPEHVKDLFPKQQPETGRHKANNKFEPYYTHHAKHAPKATAVKIEKPSIKRGKSFFEKLLRRKFSVKKLLRSKSPYK
jgi:hypothetical protein